jgi:hypothetical protein
VSTIRVTFRLTVSVSACYLVTDSRNVHTETCFAGVMSRPPPAAAAGDMTRVT